MSDLGPVTSTHPTREDAIAQCAAELAAEGGTIAVHAETCATGRGEECDCTPAVIVVSRGALA